LSGTYVYVLVGDYFRSDAGLFVPYAESGTFTADGKGGITGQSSAYVVGNSALSTLSISGSYSLLANCTGTMTLNTEVLSLQIVAGGQSVLLAPSSANFGVTGQAYRAANAGGGQCGNGSLSGTYGYLQSGGFLADSNGDISYYSEVGQITADGNGNLNTTNVANAGGGGTSETGSGTYTINSNCSGTATITYSATSSFTYNIALGEGNTFVLLESDAGGAIAGTGQLQSPGSVLPQFVFGSNTWYSALYFTNSNTISVSFTVNFTDDNGMPLTVPSLGGSSVAVTIAPNGTAVLEAPSTGTFGEGYATVTLPAGVSGNGIFQQTVAGRPNQQAVVPLASMSSPASKIPFDETGGAVTAVALANPTNAPINVTITVWDTSGNVIGTSTVGVSAYNKTSTTLDTLPGLSGMVGKQGSAQFVASTGSVAVLGLRFIAGGAFTSVPATGN